MRKTWNLITLLIVIALLGFAVNVQAAEYWKAKWMRYSGVAGETLATGDVVYICTGDGYAYQCAASEVWQTPPCGVIGQGGSTGATVEIVYMGILSGQTFTEYGQPVWVGTTAGEVTDDGAINYQYSIGFVINATDCLIDIRPPTSN